MQKNFEGVFKVFRKTYVPIPLEVFGRNKYKTLISTLLSSRTKDETTLAASKRLFKKAPSLKKLKELTVKEIRNEIYPVGFYKTKANHIKALAKFLVEEKKGQIPKTREALMILPGVGRKTANLVLNRAFGKPAIAVDTHVHKITNFLGWVNTTSPEKTEEALTKILPKRYWEETNRLFVSIGRQFTTKGRLEAFLKKNSLI